jgi:hypothetical protein
LLDRLTATRILAAWHHHRDMDEVLWRLPRECAPPHSAVHARQHHGHRP